MSGGNTGRPFEDRRPEEYGQPDLNPYLKLHREYGPPVVVGEEAPGFRGRWAAAFDGREAPLHVEVGPGNGFFLAGMAARHPEQNWLGVEIRFKRVVLCAKKIDSAGISNARVARYDAWWLRDLFEEGEIDGLYVNFPDPWKKARHESKRLMGPAFAAWAGEAMADGALLRLKTDDGGNVARLREALSAGPFEILAVVEDVAREGLPWGEDDIRTNYQGKFDARGEATHALWARRLPR